MRSHAIIIGAGVLGCVTALALEQRGWKVTLIDQQQSGMESSWAGGGILFPLLPWQYSEPVNRLALAGMARHAALCDRLHQETGIDPQYQRCGMEIVAPFNREAALQWCQEYSFSCEADSERLWLPEVAQARNPRLMQALRAMVLKRGISLIEQTRMQPLQGEGPRIAAWEDAHGQKHCADIFIVTAGAWSQGLLGKHALHLNMKPMRGQMLLYQLPPGTLPHIQYCEDFYLIPRIDGHILAGSTVEDVGFDKSTPAESAALLAAKAARLQPVLATSPIIKHWSGLRPGSPENIPVIDRHPQFDNCYLNTGHFRYGVTMAPISAEILASQICGETSLIDASPYRFPAST
jgi:glycine oxidase